LVVNLSLMSRRPIDKGLGGQEPSDVGILQGEIFDHPGVRRVLPPEEDEDQDYIPSSLPPHDPHPTIMLHEEEMTADIRAEWEHKKAG
jgi:hypothetical protein